MSMRGYWYARAIISVVVVVSAAAFFLITGDLTYQEKSVLIFVSFISIIMILFLLYRSTSIKR